MSDEPVCPFSELLERRALGDSTEEEERRLEGHVAEGCPSCGPLYEAQASFETLLQGAFRPLEDEAEARRAVVLSRVKEAVAREEDRSTGRRLRRRSLRFAFYSIVLSLVVLLATFYVGFVAINNALQRRILRDTARLEARALVGALEAYGRDHGELPDGDLVRALSSPRKDAERPYYVFDRVQDGRALDPFRRPWVYERIHAKKARLRSFGPNGRDEQGLGDDVALELQLAR